MEAWFGASEAFFRNVVTRCPNCGEKADVMNGVQTADGDFHAFNGMVFSPAQRLAVEEVAKEVSERQVITDEAIEILSAVHPLLGVTAKAMRRKNRGATLLALSLMATVAYCKMQEKGTTTINNNITIIEQPISPRFPENPTTIEDTALFYPHRPSDYR